MPRLQNVPAGNLVASPKPSHYRLRNNPELLTHYFFLLRDIFDNGATCDVLRFYSLMERRSQQRSNLGPGSDMKRLMSPTAKPKSGLDPTIAYIRLPTALAYGSLLAGNGLEDLKLWPTL